MSKQALRAVVIGGGVMGAGIATVFAAGGWRIDVVSPSQKTRDALPGKLADGMKRLGADPASCRAGVYATLAELDWQDVAIVVESVTEDLALKQKLFAEMEALSPAAIPLTSNSSSYPISEIGKGLTTQSRMMGLHFFMPAHIAPLVEIVRSVHTDVALAERVGEWMRALGKRPVQVRRDIIGFLGNRIQAALMREALYLIDAGIATPEDVDAAVRYGFGFRYAAAGPILQKEHSGWDTTNAVSDIIYPDLCNASASIPVLRKMAAERRIGMKTGQGFYKWDSAAIAREKARYEKALMATLAILKAEE